MEVALRFYDERYYPSRIEGMLDPTPHLTKKFADRVAFHIWAIDPASCKGVVRLELLRLRAEKSTCRNDSAALFRPLQGLDDSGRP